MTTTATDTYKVVRIYFSGDYATEVVSTGLTREQAQAYCQDPQTSSSTCTDPEAVERTALRGAWFCGFEREGLDDEENDSPWDDDAEYEAELNAALDLADEVPEGECRVQVAYDNDTEDGYQSRSQQTITLPYWCSADPAAGAALYLFGYAGAVDVLHITAEVVG